MKGSAASNATGGVSADVARAFTTARRQARALPGFPGPLPADLAAAYAIQDQALAQWGEPVVGWKVGRIAPDLQAALGEARVAGPVFARNLWTARPGETLDVPVFEGGFAAVEGEFVYRLGADAPAGKTRWTARDALDIADALFVGVETAGSPLATINQLGPLVVASDFGNNWGLILGQAVEGWRERAFDALTCRTFIDDSQVGAGSAADLPGGPAEAFAWLLGHCAARGRPLKRGDLVTTGAVTGVHDIVAGQTARIDFGTFGEILCRAKPARAIGEEETSNEQRDPG
ncbi:MAG: fumarylacetoacetate hydrolase family protein [Caulobacter sp.]|nr:fumarylacetoacetate hydrolase family protein [Caulobacter sp.]